MNPARTAEPIPPEESRLMTRIPRTRRWLSGPGWIHDNLLCDCRSRSAWSDRRGG